MTWSCAEANWYLVLAHDQAVFFVEVQERPVTATKLWGCLR